jgi:hypothetical protein
MDCPHCGWNLKVKEEWVNVEGYHADFVCRFNTCQVNIRATTDLLWGYENNRISDELRSKAYEILQSRGLLSTPP